MKNRQYDLTPIGDRIRSRRMELRMSQEELANRTGYSGKSAVAKIEKNVNGIPQDKVTLFARALNTSEPYLLGLVNDPEWKIGMPAKETDDVFELKDGEQIFVEKYRAADPEKKRLVAYVLGIEK